MSKLDTSVVWGPTLLARDKLDARRWAFVVEAPFDMDPAEMEDLIGTTVSVDGVTWMVRGFVPNIPQGRILAGQPIELLVATV